MDVAPTSKTGITSTKEGPYFLIKPSYESDTESEFLRRSPMILKGLEDLWILFAFTGKLINAWYPESEQARAIKNAKLEL